MGKKCVSKKSVAKHFRSSNWYWEYITGHFLLGK